MLMMREESGLDMNNQAFLLQNLMAKRLSLGKISKDLLANSVNHICGKGEHIWIGTKKGICKINIKDPALIPRWFTTNEGLPHNNIRQLHIDTKGRLLTSQLCVTKYTTSWIMMKSGSLEFSNLGALTSIASFTEDQNGNLWAGSLGHGVWMIKADSLRNYTRTSGLISDFCYSMALTKDGFPIIAHIGGISLINSEKNIIKTFQPV